MLQSATFDKFMQTRYGNVKRYSAEVTIGQRAAADCQYDPSLPCSAMAGRCHELAERASFPRRGV